VETAHPDTGAAYRDVDGAVLAVHLDQPEPQSVRIESADPTRRIAAGRVAGHADRRHNPDSSAAGGKRPTAEGTPVRLRKHDPGEAPSRTSGQAEQQIVTAYAHAETAAVHCETRHGSVVSGPPSRGLRFGCSRHRRYNDAGERDEAETPHVSRRSNRFARPYTGRDGDVASRRRAAA
jgi:hypothetical protein